jgi:hypothetical protein
MAKKPALPATYQSDAIYAVRLKKTVKLGTLTLRPINRHQIRGATLNALIEEYGQEAVDDATAIA